MANGTWVIQEMRQLGTGGLTAADDGERFIWTADPIPPDPAKGGARAAPRDTWKFGTTVNTVETVYPGSRTKSEQIISPTPKPFTLNGVWNDRYNFPGYAVAEMKRFEAMVRRCRMVLIQFQQQAFYVLIKETEYDYKYDWRIGYQFSVSVHDRPEDFQVADRSPPSPRTPEQAYDEAAIVNDAIRAANKNAPASAMKSTALASVTDKLSNASATLNGISATIDSRKGALQPVGDFRRMASQFRILQGDCSGVLNSLVGVRSDIDLGIRTAISVLDFENWSRDVRAHCRLLAFGSQRSARDLEERQEPAGTSVYRPRKGESLYHVSRKVYGTPHGWRLIAERNNLHTLELDGTETLIIPERGGG